MTHEENLLAIYTAYPSKIGRRKALQSIERAIHRLAHEEQPMPEDAAVSFLIDAAKEFALSPAGNRGVYTPHPTTWFNQSRYLDDREQWWNVTRDELREIRNRNEANVGVWRPV